MATCYYILQCVWSLSISLSLYFVHTLSTSHVYIVYLGQNQFGGSILTRKFHVKLLSNVFESEAEAKKSMLYSYKHSFSGFSAKLNSTQAAILANKKEVISVFKSKTLKLHTTRSWDFLGLPLDSTDDDQQTATPLQLTYGDNVIVGMFDTGIWPESESFKEGAYCIGPIPRRWKGECVKGDQFDPKTSCNRKLIGARYYLKGFEAYYGALKSPPEYRSPRDFLGHGTHTASTAVGSISPNASFLGFALGTARGGAPRARLAAYKVCWSYNYNGLCSEADVMAAMDEALHDGVDVISASFGSPPPLVPLFESAAGIGSFHAVQRGVTVVFAGGNNGPDPSYVINVSPWGVCVAASTIDRSFPSLVRLSSISNSNSKFSFTGQGLITNEIVGKLSGAITYFEGEICERTRWTKKNATGRVILCFSNKGPVDAEIAQDAVKLAKGSALIFVEPPTKQIAEVDIVPTIRVDIAQGTKIYNHLRQLPKVPRIQILPSTTVIGKPMAPVVASFSSRGPSSLSPDILKPDITAPGSNILAAWPSKTPPTVLPGDIRRVNWNFQSGTSMSCPHVTGIVALLKSAHPDWSPAAIRSALVTTASTRDKSEDTILAGGTGKASDPFDVGAGHVDPVKAMDPGLIYDNTPTDYLISLCNLGYTSQHQINALLLPNTTTTTTTTNNNNNNNNNNTPSSSSTKSISPCSSSNKYMTNADMNYPSITVSNLRSTTTIKRTVRNVGASFAITTKVSIYWIGSITEPDGVEVHIWPRLLIFSWFREENSYYVTLRPVKDKFGDRFDFGEIVWTDGSHFVRSPLVVLVNTTTTNIASATIANNNITTTRTTTAESSS